MPARSRSTARSRSWPAAMSLLPGRRRRCRRSRGLRRCRTSLPRPCSISKPAPPTLSCWGAVAEAAEFAQAFRRLGAEVTVLDGQAPLAGEDVALDQLAREGIAV